MRCSTDTLTPVLAQAEPRAMGWMAFCAAVRRLEKQEAAPGCTYDVVDLYAKDDRDAGVH